jgi:signal transduction histidine kinase
MQRQFILWSRRYTASLQNYLRPGKRTPSLRQARALGRQAVALGLATLDVAKNHQKCFPDSLQRRLGRGAGKRAGKFFSEVVLPIEMTHRAARDVDAQMKRLSRTLDLRSRDLAAANRSLKHGIMRRRTATLALKASNDRSRRLLAASNRLRLRLKRVTRGILGTQEMKRRELSSRLRDDIAQSLLGINIRLLTLKRDAATASTGLEREIARTRHLVDTSLVSIRRVAREIL